MDRSVTVNFVAKTISRLFRSFFIAMLAFVVSANQGVADESQAESKVETADVVLIVGAAGETKYGELFAAWAQNWTEACKLGKAKLTTVGIGDVGQKTDRERLQEFLLAQKVRQSTPLWIVFIGHGTFDGKAAKFNLRGVDISAKELGEWLQGSQRPTTIVNCASASGPFLNALSAPNRVVITATKSGYEHNFARYGKYLSESIADPTADLDKDGQTSLLEAHLSATRSTLNFYTSDGRLVTEHPLIDDNADAQGTPASFFRGVRVTKKSTTGATPDGLRAHQFHLVQSRDEENLPPTVKARRDELELAVEKLRSQKATFEIDDYYQRLEPLLVELAQTYTETTGTPSR